MEYNIGVVIDKATIPDEVREVAITLYKAWKGYWATVFEKMMGEVRQEQDEEDSVEKQMPAPHIPPQYKWDAMEEDIKKMQSGKQKLKV